ncbi:MAG: hypothetical protein C0404_04825 [Verrucomicrobia bacterium]|nr:hypothetical protein [Verrucomicrobiota bacterium]
MKRGDKWNWAFVTTALIQVGMYLYIQNLQIRFATLGGYHHNVSMGIGVLGLPLFIAPVLFAITGVVAFCGKSTAPLVGTAIGLGLYFPLLVLPWRTWPVAALALLAAGVLKKPKQRKTDSNRTSDATSEPAGAGSSSHHGRRSATRVKDDEAAEMEH